MYGGSDGPSALLVPLMVKWSISKAGDSSAEWICHFSGFATYFDLLTCTGTEPRILGGGLLLGIHIATFDVCILLEKYMDFARFTHS